MAQPTITGVTLNSGSGGSDLAVDVVDSKLWQAILVGYSTGDGAANVVMADTGLPVVAQTGATWEVIQDTAADLNVTEASAASILTAAQAVQAAVEGTLTVDLGANNDVTLATLPDTDAGDLAAMVVDLAAMEVLQTTIAGDTTSIDGKITACNTGAVVISSGTVTANLSATDNAVLDTIETNTDYGTVVGGGVEAAALRVTIANDSTGVVSVDDGGSTISIDDGGGSLTIDGTATVSGSVGMTGDLPDTAAGDFAAMVVDLAAIEVLLGTIDADTSSLAGAVSGTEVQVDVVAALPAGTNTVGGTIAQVSSSVLYDGTTACTIKRASGVVAGGAPATDAIIAAVSGKKFRILAIALFATSATANNVYLATTTDTDVLGNSGNPIPLAVDADGDNSAGFVLPYNPGGWTETSTVNEALNIVSSAAQDIIYAVTYIEVA